MEEKNSRTIQRCYKKLVDDLNVDELLDHLVAAEIFTFDDNERVRNQLTTKDKAIRLVELLVRKPHSEAFETFCDCLDETRQSHLASVLRKEKASLKPVSEGEKGYTMNVDVKALQKRILEKLSGVRLTNDESLSENKRIAEGRKQTLLDLKKQKHEELEKHLEELHKQINVAGAKIKDHLGKVMQNEIDDLVKFNGEMEREMKKNESLCSEAVELLASKDYEYVVRRGQELCDQLDASLKADLKPPPEEGPAFSASFIPGKTDPDMIEGICGKIGAMSKKEPVPTTTPAPREEKLAPKTVVGGLRRTTSVSVSGGRSVWVGGLCVVDDDTAWVGGHGVVTQVRVTGGQTYSSILPPRLRL
ncbi:hypothetical protein ScPMuIL_013194 [Solemya velum]